MIHMPVMCQVLSMKYPVYTFFVLNLQFKRLSVLVLCKDLRLLNELD
jgi:hypothetical protein